MDGDITDVRERQMPRSVHETRSGEPPSLEATTDWPDDSAKPRDVVEPSDPLLQLSRYDEHEAPLSPDVRDSYEGLRDSGIEKLVDILTSFGTLAALLG